MKINMNMIFDFCIPREYRGKELRVPKLYSEEEENFVLNVPLNAHYLFIQPYDSEEEVGDQLQLYLPLFCIKYFTSKADIIKKARIQKYYNEIPFLESRLELIFKRV